MFLRLRWLVIGMMIGVGSSAWLALRLRRVARSMRPKAVGRRAALRVAGALDDSSRRLSDSA